jgi:HEAT repeat protein
MTTVKQLIEEFRLKHKKVIERKDYVSVAAVVSEYCLSVKNLPDPSDEIAAALEGIARNHLNQMDGAGDWLTAAGIHPSTKYFDALHTMLERDDPLIWHERIVEILYDLKDERSIPSLVKALDFDNSHYDPSRELANKVLDTLDHIGTPEAQAILQKCLKSPVPQIRATAHMLLGINVTRRKRGDKTKNK